MELKENIIRKFIKAYNSFDIDLMMSLLHPDVQFRNFSKDEVTVSAAGKEEFEKLAIASARLFSQREQTITSYIEEDYKVIVKIKYHAVLAVDLPDQFKAGDNLDIEGTSEYMFKDGLIVSIVDKS